MAEAIHPPSDVQRAKPLNIRHVGRRKRRRSREKLFFGKNEGDSRATERLVCGPRDSPPALASRASQTHQNKKSIAAPRGTPEGQALHPEGAGVEEPKKKGKPTAL